LAWFKPSTILDKIFEASVLIKGVEGAVELISGISVLILGSHRLATFAFQVTAQELQEDPSDTFANYIAHTGQHLASGGTTFLVAYLLIHGLIKLIAVFSLLRNQLWGYPFSMATLGVFMLYQVYEVAHAHSLTLALLTVFDIFLMWLIYREFQIQRAKQTTTT
jgi:uncharacterized membrane protein